MDKPEPIAVKVNGEIVRQVFVSQSLAGVYMPNYNIPHYRMVIAAQDGRQIPLVAVNILKEYPSLFEINIEGRGDFLPPLEEGIKADLDRIVKEASLPERINGFMVIRDLAYRLRHTNGPRAGKIKSTREEILLKICRYKIIEPSVRSEIVTSNLRLVQYNPPPSKDL